jgi:hypothetical protein
MGQWAATVDVNGSVGRSNYQKFNDVNMLSKQSRVHPSITPGVSEPFGECPSNYAVEMFQLLMRLRRPEPQASLHFNGGCMLK